MAAHLVQGADDAGLPGVVAIDDGEPDGLDSMAVRMVVMSSRSSRLMSATRKPRCPMPTISPRDISRDRPSRSGVAPIS
jgi:hypothetical protein